MHQSAGTRQTSTDQPLTDHAQMRMGQRGISEKIVALVLLHGRTVHARGATYRVIGHKEVSRCALRGISVGALLALSDQSLYVGFGRTPA